MTRTVVLLLLLAIPGPLLAADGGAPATRSPAPSSPNVVESGPASATLRFFNRDIVTLRAPYFGYHPAERAAAGARRIREVLDKGGPGVVAVTRGSDGLAVSID